MMNFEIILRVLAIILCYNWRGRGLVRRLATGGVWFRFSTGACHFCHQLYFFLVLQSEIIIHEMDFELWKAS